MRTLSHMRKLFISVSALGLMALANTTAFAQFNNDDPFGSTGFGSTGSEFGSDPFTSEFSLLGALGVNEGDGFGANPINDIIGSMYHKDAHPWEGGLYGPGGQFEESWALFEMAVGMDGMEFLRRLVGFEEEGTCENPNPETVNDFSLEDLQQMSDFNPNGLTEVQIAIMGAINSGAVADMALNARQTAISLFPNDPGARDAFRHVYWSYSLTSVFGPQLAEAFTDAHEVTGNNNAQPIEELYMDLFNNTTGRILFEIHGNGDFGGADVQNLIVDAINNGNIVTQVPTSCGN